MILVSVRRSKPDTNSTPCPYHIETHYKRAVDIGVSQVTYPQECVFIWFVMLTTFLVHGQVLPVALRSHNRRVISPIFLPLHTI